jgi:CheY-like chemotaxis protein
MGMSACLAAPRPARHGSRPTVVVVDDDPSMRALIRLILAASGYEVLEAEDGLAGRHLVMASSPDLVLCDVHMPRMDGFELLEALKSDALTRHVPVVLVTADEDAAAVALVRGAAACLTKPLEARRLIETASAFAGPAAGSAIASAPLEA